MTLTIGKKIGIGFAIARAALLAIGIGIARNLAELDQDSFWVTHTVEVKARLAALESDLLLIVQDPASAEGAAMPEAAIDEAGAHDIRQLDEIAGLLVRLTADRHRFAQ